MFELDKDQIKLVSGAGSQYAREEGGSGGGGSNEESGGGSGGGSTEENSYCSAPHGYK